MPRPEKSSAQPELVVLKRSRARRGGAANSGRSIDSVLDRLDGVRKTPQGWSARCPAHEDHRNSLSVAEGMDGRVLLYCFAGCQVEAIVAALDLTLADLFAAGAESQSPPSGNERPHHPL